ncbi:MAG: twin-arginine translocase TatA/TatE family subunit [Ktedonobacteraceae bacterium]
MGFHPLDWVIIIVIGLAIFGPKTLQSLARNAGKTISQAKTVKDKVMAELPLEELSEVSREIPRVPMNSYQAIEMLMTPESGGEPLKKPQEPKRE